MRDNESLALLQGTPAVEVIDDVAPRPAFRNQAGRARALLRHGMALGQCFFNERHEGARLRAWASSSRKDRP
jgi:hypothetical protein